MKIARIPVIVVALSSLALPACSSTHAEEQEHSHQEHNKIVVTSPQLKEVVVTQQYVCQIRSQRHIEVRAMEEGYLEAVPVKEGQSVKTDQVMFRVIPALYRAKLDAELAEVRLAELERDNTRRLKEQKVVSDQELALFEAKLARARAKAAQAEAELNFSIVKAPFDGIIDRLGQQQGSLVKKEDLLTTLSDNSVMWVYFNVPEARYLEYMSSPSPMDKDRRIQLADSRIELRLANGNIFNESPGNYVTVEGKFNNETGNIAFRADFPNPKGLLRHGQTGTVLIHRTIKNALVIPQRATFEILDKLYVYVLDKDNVAHQRWITVEHELDDIFVVKSGLNPNEKIVLEGVRDVREGQKVEFEYREPKEVLSNQKHHAE